VGERPPARSVPRRRSFYVVAGSGICSPPECRHVIAANTIGIFVNLVLDGLAIMRAGGEELPSTDLV
jgi:hypothetical protein